MPENPQDSATSGELRTQVRKVRIDGEQAGQRIDNFLRRQLPGVPRGRIYRILRKGEVRVNGGRVKAEYKLAEGDEVRVPPVRVRADGDPPAPGKVKDVENRILFENKKLIVLNKPSGLAVHGGSGVSHGAIEILRHARPELRDLSLVHRIDRETSGCLVLAKRRSALREMHEKFREGDVTKNYLGLVVGDWQLGEQLIDRPLLVSHRKGGERHVVISGAGKAAQTRVKLSRAYPKHSLVHCEPITGRTHQIRVHLQSVEHPLAGDSRYGDVEHNAGLARLGLKRLFLHAQSISFADDSGNEQTFTAPLAEDLEKFLANLSASQQKG